MAAATATAPEAAAETEAAQLAVAQHEAGAIATVAAQAAAENAAVATAADTAVAADEHHAASEHEAAAMASVAAQAAAEKAAVAVEAKVAAEIAAAEHKGAGHVTADRAASEKAGEKLALDEPESIAGNSEAAMQPHGHLGMTPELMRMTQPTDAHLSGAGDMSAPVPSDADDHVYVALGAPASEKAAASQMSTVQSLAAGIGCLVAAILICAAPLICKFW